MVLLHGFPDSWALWKDFLSQKQNLDRDTVYVALDLPGYGGSDSLAEYNAYNVLEAVTGFVLGMREKYGVDGSGEEGGAVGGAADERGQVVLVSHDWGGAVAGRLASEAPQLADHFVIVSIVLVSGRTLLVTILMSLGLCSFNNYMFFLFIPKIYTMFIFSFTFLIQCSSQLHALLKYFSRLVLFHMISTQIANYKHHNLA